MIKKEVQVPLQYGSLTGNLRVPDNAKGLVIFAHGSGSSRLSIRNNYVAEKLNQQQLATLLADLLTPIENETYSNRFDITLLCDRLVSITNWAKTQGSLAKLHVGYFGASTGVAAALMAAATLKNKIKAVVSRGGRGDLARGLAHVDAPVLLLVGSLDVRVLELNELVYDNLHCEKSLRIIQGASHLFEEPGKLVQVVELAGAWFDKHLVAEKAAVAGNII